MEREEALNFEKYLERDGYCCFATGLACEAEISLAADRISEFLGHCIEGRAGAIRETVTPRNRAEAHPRSQSVTYGLDALPLHVELSHRPAPCRYVLLGCFNPGDPGSATTMLEWRGLGFTSDEIALLKGAPILVRNGRNSFYTTAIPPDGRFLRYDAECVEAVDTRGRTALETIQARLSSAESVAHTWRRGEILVIDNWRILHGREAVPEQSCRRLTRRLVNA